MRWLLFCFAVIGTQAQSLSCLRPDPASSFAQYRDAPDPYYILQGTLTFDQSLMPEGVENTPRDPAPVPARFEGRGLTDDGFNVMLNREITLQPMCAGPWCGNLESGQNYLMFARAIDNGITLFIDPCYSTTFIDPAPLVLQQMEACMADGC